MDDDAATLPETNGGGGGGGGGGGMGTRFRQPSFLKWRQNHKSDVSGMNVDGEFKKWPHPPEALHKGKVTYVVKFLGFVNVEESKGIDVVRGAIQKMKFNKTVKKAEGIKTAKKELVVSVDSLTIQDSKYKIVDHCYPLHRISFCADDKNDKRMFAFIAKDGEAHICYVFDSEKCAEEITLTVGQAFEIAYQNFVNVQGKPSSSLKEEMVKLRNQVEMYEKENGELKSRVRELEAKLGIAGAASSSNADAAKEGAAKNDAAKDGVVNGGVEVNLIDTGADVLPMSPAPHQQDTAVDRRLENLLFDEEELVVTSAATTASASPLPASPSTPASSSSSFPPLPLPLPRPTTETHLQETAAATTTTNPSSMPSLAPPPRPSRRQAAAASTAATAASPAPAAAPGGATDLFGSPPFVAPAAQNGTASKDSKDPFGHHDDLFGMTPFQSEYQPPFQNPMDISFGSGNFDFGSSFQQDFNQNNSSAKEKAPSTMTSGSTTSNPFIQFN